MDPPWVAAVLAAAPPHPPEVQAVVDEQNQGDAAKVARNFRRAYVFRFAHAKTHTVAHAHRRTPGYCDLHLCLRSLSCMNAADRGMNGRGPWKEHGARLRPRWSMAAVTRALDWSATPLGPVEGWPQSLRTTVEHRPTQLVPDDDRAGRDLWMLDNDASLPDLAGYASAPRRVTRIRIDGGSQHEVRVVVKNDGSIPPEQLPKLFEPFVGPRDRKKWPGLGLVSTSLARSSRRGKDGYRFGRRMHAVRRALPRAEQARSRETTPGSEWQLA